MLDKKEIKKFLTHDEKCIREKVRKFFIEGNIYDNDLIFKLLDIYDSGVDYYEGLGLLSNISELPQTESSIMRLNSIKSTDFSSSLHIDSAILRTDIDLLKNHTEIIPHSAENIKKYKERFNFASSNTGKLWDILWKYSKSGAGKNLDKFDFNYGKLIISELVLRKDFPLDKFYSKINSAYPENYDGWDDSYLCVIAGELKNEEAIPFLLDCIRIDSDFICDRAMEGLGKVGSNKVLQAIKDVYIKENKHFRMFISGALEKIKTSECERLLMELLPLEKDISIKTSLAAGLCGIFSADAIPQLITLMRYGYDKMFFDLEEGLYVTHIINGISHPELMKWKQIIDANEKKMTNVEDDFLRIIESDMNEWNIKERISEGMEKFMERMNETKQLNELYKTGIKVGRNDPCPCASGKKFKKCCGK
jgi:hypothetical protein